MNELISKELLSDVLGVEVVRIGEFNGSNLQVYIEHLEYADYYEIAFKRKNDWFSTINIHELAHKCKVWAGDLDYVIQTGVRLDGTKEFDVLCIHKNQDIEDDESIYYQDTLETEPEAIFKACEWIREQL